MKFIIQKSAFADVLSKIQGLTGRKSNLAITANALVTASGSEITVMATDLETGFEGSYPAQVGSEGSIAINARKLYEIVRDFPIDDININEVENRWIEIGNKNIEFHIVGMNPEDFPDIPQIEEVNYFDLPADNLRKMIEKSLVIGPSDDKRAHIIGVYLEVIAKDDQKILRMVSTDGSRLSTVDYACGSQTGPGIEEGVMIPKKGLNEVLKFLNTSATVQIGFKDNNFIIKKNTEIIIIRLLEGDFPKYQDIVTKKDVNEILLKKNLFLMMLKRMSILSSENYKGVIFNFLKDKLLVTSTNPDIGESKEEMEIDYDGQLIEVAFNPRYFIETLNVIEDENIIVNIVNDEKPCIIEGEKEKDFISVIMPMRI